MIQRKTYVCENEHGFRVGACDISLDSVVLAYQEGYSPEVIQQHFPALTLEEVYGAIVFYLANKEEVEEYLKRQDAIWQIDANPSPVGARLRAIAAARARGER